MTSTRVAGGGSRQRHTFLPWIRFQQVIGVRTMRLYGAIQKIEPQDDGTVRVHGIATSEALDDQGEIVRAEAVRAAIPDYMRFPALREMHQLSAAGTTLEAEVGDDGTTRIVAHVVDPVAVAKVKNQVYRGFSIGGRVTQREPGNPKSITGLVLNEISLVDRPANPEAIYDCWKASPIAALADKGFNAPMQIWTCGVLDHQHVAKADAIKCLEKQKAQPESSEGRGETAASRQDHQRHTDKPPRGSSQKDAISPRDQMLMDIAYTACDKCSKLDVLPVDAQEHIVDACEQLIEAGAALPDGLVGASQEMLGVFAEMLSEHPAACQAMMDVAHQCINQLSGGASCRAIDQRQSPAPTERLQEAHGHLVAAGAQCDAESLGRKTLKGQQRDGACLPETTAQANKIPPAGELSENSRDLNLLAAILPALERLTKRVDEIARTPLPPLTIAKSMIAVAKQQDHGSTETEISTEAIASAFARMSKEDQTLTLIKASYANPIRVLGPAIGER